MNNRNNSSLITHSTSPFTEVNEIILTLSAFKEKNKEKYNIEKLGLFGSYTRNSYSKESDIDIIVKTKRADLFLLVHMKEELEELLKMKVDLVRYRKRMNTFLKQHIDEEAIYV